MKSLNCRREKNSQRVRQIYIAIAGLITRTTAFTANTAKSYNCLILPLPSQLPLISAHWSQHIHRFYQSISTHFTTAFNITIATKWCQMQGRRGMRVREEPLSNCFVMIISVNWQRFWCHIIRGRQEGKMRGEGERGIKEGKSSCFFVIAIWVNWVRVLFYVTMMIWG